MDRALAILLAISLMAVLLIGCGQTQAQPLLAIDCETFLANPIQAREATLSAKGSFCVALCANPSTGYKMFALPTPPI